jgi:hypothetical protein
MGGEDRRDAIIKRLDRGDQRSQLRRVGVDREAERLDDRRVGGERPRRGDRR